MLRHKTIMCYLVGVLTNESDLGFFLIKTHLSFYQRNEKLKHNTLPEKFQNAIVERQLMPVTHKYMNAHLLAW